MEFYLRTRLVAWPAIDRVLLALAIAGGIAAAGRLAVSTARSGAKVEAVPVSVPGSIPQPRVLAQTSERDLIAAVALDPFRPDRSAPAARYVLDEPSASTRRRRAGSRDAPRIPHLRLRGIATDGRLWLAVIEGVPGTQRARAYRPGDSVHHFVLQAVDAEDAVLVGSDTSLVLRIDRPWTGEP